MGKKKVGVKESGEQMGKWGVRVEEAGK